MMRLLYTCACCCLAGVSSEHDRPETCATTAGPASGNSTAALDGEATTTGSISVTITYEGAVPRSQVPDEMGHRHELLSVDRKTKGLRYVLAYLDEEHPRAEIRNDAATTNVDQPQQGDESGPLTIDQLEHQFVPRLIAVRDGSPVVFTNSDPANHNVRGTSFVAENNFSVFVPLQQEYRHRFRADGKQRPVVLSCDIHPWMKAWIYVFDHPWFAVSDAAGKLRIDGINPGRHDLQLRQPDVAFRAIRNVQVTAGETTRIELRISDRDLRR